ncbi:hypothetical protein [uncultured Gimesia sp.]|mgnify:CR=1 FL=1|uniref:hypothetical protein n=1 Tax=uncultured Gimesia sp. TaxID=1678688 RepID=UPI00260C745F|nr:hypothetical protein [uncultured Gimesia sp.]
MWPFSKLKRNPVEPVFNGYCPNCGRELDSVRPTCTNELPILTCKPCDKTFDYSYNPSRVFFEVQWQRRNCHYSAMKQLLRESQMPEPKYIRERNWAVYELPDGSTFFYNSADKIYDVQMAGKSPITIGNIQQVIDYLTDKVIPST